MFFYYLNKSRWNNVTYISLINFFSSLYFYLPYMTLYYQQNGLNLFWINSLSSVMTAVTLIGEIPTGIFADKYGRKFSIILALSLQTLGEILFLFSRNYFFFFIVAVIAGLGWAFRSGCEDALLYDSLKDSNREKDMVKASGLRLSSALLGVVSSSIVASLLVAGIGISFPLMIYITAISVSISLLLAFFLKEPAISLREKRESFGKIFSSGLKYLWKNSNLKKISILYMFTAPFFQFLLITYPPFFISAGIPKPMFGIAYTIGATLAFMGNRYSHLLEKRFSRKTSLIVAVSLPALFYILLATIIHPLTSFFIFILLFGSMSIQNPIFTALQNDLIDHKNRATILSMINMVLGGYIIIMELLLGMVSSYSISLSYILIGVQILLSLVIFLLMKAKIG